VKILMTGASSFTGLHFARELAAAGHEVAVVFQRPQADAYDEPLRRRRVELAADCCEPIFGCTFGDSRWLQLVQTRSFDCIAAHGAQVTGYRDPAFDFAGALAANTHRLADTLAALVGSAAPRIVLSGTVFEGGEGAGSDGLPHFSAYGLSKALTAEAFRFACAAAGVTFGKFVIPNPFGPWEEARFTHYLVRCWRAGNSVTVNTPAYIRDNIHASLLAKAYVRFVESLPTDGAQARCNPSGYVESQGAFAERFAREMGPRLGIECPLVLAHQTEFAEPRIRINTDPVDTLALGWDETAAWDALADYYRDLAP
jgi:UDP-glucose 4-epimerase